MGAIDQVDVVDIPSAKKPRIAEDMPRIEVTVCGKVSEHPQGVQVCQLVSSEDAVAARVDNEVVSLSHRIMGSGGEVEPVPLASPDGIRVLVETLKFMLKIAKQETMPHVAVTIGRPIGAAYYCWLNDRTTKKTHVPSEEELQKFRDAMIGLIDAAEPMRSKIVASQAALDKMKQTGAHLTHSIIKDINQPQVEVVECRGMYHLPRFPVLANTAAVPKDSFKITAFKDGFFLEHLRCDYKTGTAKHWTYESAASDLLYNEYTARLEWTRAVDLYTVAQLNTAIRNGESKKVIQAVEANCDRQFVELAAKVKARNDVKLLLIAGPSSSGKTTFAKRLQVQLEALGYKPFVLSVDSFYKAWQDITSEGPQKVDWEALASLNLQQLNDVLLTLLAGKEVLVPEYDMKTSMPADKAHWSKAKLDSSGRGMIIMEGIHCLNPALTPAVPKAQKFQIAIAPIPALQLDAVHVLSGTTIRMLRRMVRDYLNRGRPVLATLKQWPSVVAGELSNIYPHQHNADAVMNSEIGYEMCVLKVHAEPLLKTVSSGAKEYSEVRRLLQTLDQFIALPTNIIPPQSLLREFVGGSWYYDYGGWYKSY
jgi:uridine kinase